MAKDSTLDTATVGYFLQDAKDILTPLLSVHALLHNFNSTRKHIAGPANRLTSRIDDMIEAACAELIDRIDTKYE